MPAFLALPLTLLVMFLLAVAIERVVLRPLVNQPDIVLFMATIGITLFLIGFGEIVFGGENKVMISDALMIPNGSYQFEPFGGFVSIEQRDLTTVIGAVLLVAVLLLFLNRSNVGRAIRAFGDDHQAALSVGISLSTIWVIVWFIAGIIALATGIAAPVERYRNHRGIMAGYNDKKLRRALANIDARLTKIEAGMRGDASRRLVTKTQSAQEKPKAMRRGGGNLLLPALDTYRARSS